MKLVVYFICGIGLLILSSGCGQFESDAVEGTWNASLVTEGLDTVQLDLSQVRLTFVNGQFVFQRSAIDSIKGKYTLKDDLLVMISEDTAPPDTLTVQIKENDRDKLALRMNSDGVEQIVYLRRD